MKKITFISSLFAILMVFAVSASAATTTIKWHGHAAFEITTPKGKVLFIDPWLKNPMNPAAQGGKDPVAAISKADYILVTHGHFDHTGDATALAKKTKARLVTGFELGTNMARILGYPKSQMGFDTLFNTGGEIQLGDAGEITVAATPAVHTSGIDHPKNDAKNIPVAYGGNPMGFVIKIKDGPTIYHSGDTAYFSDMSLIGETYSPDVALLNIGGHFGMEPTMAAKAASAIKAKIVIPHHYKTFPILTQDPSAFAKQVADSGMKAVVMEPGATVTFEGNQIKK